MQKNRESDGREIHKDLMIAITLAEKARHDEEAFLRSCSEFLGRVMQPRETRLLREIYSDNIQHLHQNPYHSDLHCLQVAYIFMALLKECDNRSSDLLFWGLAAALGHDSRHPGRTNSRDVELEMKSARFVEAAMIRHGFVPHGIAIVRELILSTYVGFRKVLIDINLGTKLATDQDWDLAWFYLPRTPVDRAIGMVAGALSDADLLISIMTSSLFDEQSRRLAKEIPEFQKLTIKQFAENVIHGQFASPAAQPLSSLLVR